MRSPEPKPVQFETLKRPITRAEVKAAIKGLPPPKKPMAKWVHSQILPDIKKGAGTIPSETIPNNPKRGNPSQIILGDQHHPDTKTQQQEKKTSGQYP